MKLAALGISAAVLEWTILLFYQDYRTRGGMSFYVATYDLFDGLILFGLALLCGRMLVQTDSTTEDTSTFGVTRSGVSLVALVVLLTTYAGTKLVYEEYPFSTDEYMAELQAQVFAEGRLSVPLTGTFRNDSPRLRPLFMMQADDHSAWVSTYLPVYAACRAIFAYLGQSWLTNPTMGALSILLIAAVAKKLWPEEKSAPLVAALLLATSTQVLVTSMSAYAMPGHLMFNLLWLYLFLHHESWKFALTPWVGGLAIGLHQPTPHLLFAFPFFVGMLWHRRWAVFIYFSAVYLLFVGIWNAYFTYIHQAGALSFAQYFSFWNGKMIVQGMIVALQLFTWQSVATGALVLVSLGRFRKYSPFFMQCAASFALTFFFYSLFVLGPGHGWGARYLYSVLGNWILIAIFGYVELVREGCRPMLKRVLIFSTIAAVFVQLPARCLEVSWTIRPFRSAYADIMAQDADFVILYDRTGWYMQDLVRNGPDVTRQRPLIFRAEYMNDKKIADLKKRGKTVILQQKDLARDGLLKPYE